MARYVTVSTIGARAPVQHPGTGPEAVEQIILHLGQRLSQVLAEQPDLIVIPECCDRFPSHTMAERQAYYRHRGDQVRDYLASVAREHSCYITYPAIRAAADGAWRNSVQLLDRGGEVAGVYDKNFPVITETTEGGIQPGADAAVIDCDFGRVGCAICFDLNFAEIRQRYVDLKPDLILFPSMYHGGLMQPYWAYSCRAHLVAAVCGLPSAIYSPVGHIIAQSTNYFDYVTTRLNLDCGVAHLDFNQDGLRGLKTRYGNEVTIFDPGFLGSVLITSDSRERSADEMLSEFEIEPLDDYMARSITHRHDHLKPE
jgi:predicted amidohydrolase